MQIALHLAPERAVPHVLAIAVSRTLMLVERVSVCLAVASELNYSQNASKTLHQKGVSMFSVPGQNRYEFSAIHKRKDYSWPGGKRLAFYIALNIEHFAWGAGRVIDPTNRSAAPSQRNYAWRDYGNRVGNWRLFEVLEELGLPATILLNSEVARLYPDLVERIKQRGDDVLGHGRTNSELLSGRWEDDERHIIKEVTQQIEKHFGVRPTGWMGPGAAESNVTPDLLKEEGYTHCLDWPVDDQPLWMRTRAGPILSVPYPLELNDAGTLVMRDHTGRQFAEMITDQFEDMVKRCEDQPLVMALSLHGFIVGQPFRLHPLVQALRHCREHKLADRVWWTRAGEIADFCFKQPKGTILGSEILDEYESEAPRIAKARRA